MSVWSAIAKYGSPVAVSLLLAELMIGLSAPGMPPPVTARAAAAQAPRQVSTNFSVPEIARQVTVRVLSRPAAGSGVIVQRQGQTYTVLTNQHVVAGSYDDRYQVLTADGVMHSGRWLQSVKLGDADLAIVQFNSSRFYTVVVISPVNTLTEGDVVYAAGFPNWFWINGRSPRSTYDWGLKAFKLTSGNVGLILKHKRLPRGYRLGYTNPVENGMSGGPVLDAHGQLVGINGRLKHPIDGIRMFSFTDGTFPSQEQFLQMNALSWAIPVSMLQGVLRI